MQIVIDFKDNGEIVVTGTDCSGLDLLEAAGAVFNASLHCVGQEGSIVDVTGVAEDALAALPKGFTMTARLLATCILWAKTGVEVQSRG